MSFLDSLTGTIMTEFFRDVRDAQFESENDQNGTVTFSVINYITALNLDYNVTSLYSITKSGNIVTVTANNPDSQFTMVDNNPAISTVINNEAPPITFSIDAITISEADSNPCDNVKITVTTNEQADSLTSPLIQVINTNPYVFTAPRQDIIFVSVAKDGKKVSKNIRVPKLLSSYFKVNILSTPSLGAISVSKLFLYTPLFTLQYSLDNVTWQNSNYFGNLPIGNYTVYIKDSIGCTLSIDFTLDTFAPNLKDYDAICEVSNLNSIRYKEAVTWNDYVLKTPYNTLSFEENVLNPNMSFTQLWTNIDIVKTQIKTNYSTVSAKIIKDDDTEETLTVTKMTNNMDITDIRDGVVLSTTYNGLSYASIKFRGGNTYDSTTLLDNGDYNIGTAVPSWMNAGDYINIQGAGWYKIEDVVYNTDAYVVVLNLLVNDFPLTLGTFKITSVYNDVDWESYEFACNFTTLEGYYKVQIDVSDTDFGSKQYLSEWQNVKASHRRTRLIEAYNTENNEINYSTGFSSRLRIPYIEDLEWNPNSEVEVYVTDTNTVNLESKQRKFWIFKSGLLPLVMAQKLAMILILDRLFIDGVNYLSEGSPDVKKVGSQYQVTGNLVESNYIFDSNSNIENLETLIDGTLLSISPGGGFLRVD